MLNIAPVKPLSRRSMTVPSYASALSLIGFFITRVEPIPTTSSSGRVSPEYPISIVVTSTWSYWSDEFTASMASASVVYTSLPMANMSAAVASAPATRAGSMKKTAMAEAAAINAAIAADIIFECLILDISVCSEAFSAFQAGPDASPRALQSCLASASFIFIIISYFTTLLQ